MNQKDIEDFKDLKRIVKSNTIILARIDRTLSGNPEDRDDLGLVGDVRNNKRWKGNVNKALSGLGLGVGGLFIKQIFEFFKRGG